MSSLFSPLQNIPAFYLWIGIVYWMHSYTAFAAMIQDLVILDELLKKGYDRRATPTNHYNSTSPTTAYVSIIVSSISSPSPLSMDYKTDLYLRQKWKDERLKHKDLKQPLDLSDPNLVKAIWKPEIYFPNAKEADFHFVTVPNVLVRIHPDGEILYMLRLRVTFSCMMDLSKFPLDRQKCTMEVASFSKTVEELLLEWVPHNPVVTAPLRLTLFELDKIETKLCPESSGQIGNYSCLVAEFHLSRSLGFHLVQSYLPTILMVVISWVSFWMDVNSVPGRVTLGITTLLTVSSISTNIQENLPQASYVKAIDVWLGTCTAFVFLALLEFTFVNYLFRSAELRDYYREEQQCYRPYHISAEERGGSSLPQHNHHHHHSHHMCSGAGMNGCQKVEQFRSSSPSPLPTVPATLVQQVLGTEKEQEVVGGGGGKLSNHLEPQFIGASASPHSSLCDPSYPPVVGDLDDEMKSPRKDLLSERNKRKHHVQDPQAQARSIDETCRYAFPLAFALFNCVYWPYYLLT